MLSRAAFLFLACGLNVQAHDPGLSSAGITLGAKEIVVQLLVAPSDLQALQDSSAEAIAGFGVEMNAAGTALRPTDLKKTVAGPDTGIRLIYSRPHASTILYRSPLIAALPHGHRQILTVRDDAGALLLSRLLSAREDRVEIAMPDPGIGAGVPSTAPQTSSSGFLLLGIHHILAGYDHLLFLFALLLVCDGFWSTAKIITCFTAAHSLTLALATLDIVQIPGGIVEPIIAGSIIYVALENLFVRRQRRSRLVLTFAFGLVHGLGFASVLRDLGVNSGGLVVAVPLLSFNLGVEIGQLAIAALLLPLILWLRGNPAFLSRGVPACSLLIAAAGGYWLLERTLW